MIPLSTIAGEILIFLEEKKEPVSIRDIYLSFGYSKENICMAVGWLAREGVVRVAHDTAIARDIVSLMEKKQGK